MCCICSCGVCGGAIGVNFGAVGCLCVLMCWHSALMGLLIRLSYRFVWGVGVCILGDVSMGCLLGGIGCDVHFLFFSPWGVLWWGVFPCGGGWCACVRGSVGCLRGVLAWVRVVGRMGAHRGARVVMRTLHARRRAISLT